MKNTLILIVVGFIIGILGNRAIYYASDYRIVHRFDKDNLEWYQQTYLTRAGATALNYDEETQTMTVGEMVNYNLKSFDGGLSWYSVRRSGDTLKIVGPADPELVKSLNSVDMLVGRSKKVTAATP